MLLQNRKSRREDGKNALTFQAPPTCLFDDLDDDVVMPLAVEKDVILMRVSVSAVANIAQEEWRLYPVS